jgi:hypothetical protein
MFELTAEYCNQMKTLFEDIAKDMKVIIGKWNESTVKELLKVVVTTASGKPQSINMEALDRLQKQLEKLESKHGSQLRNIRDSHPPTKNKHKSCDIQ